MAVLEKEKTLDQTLKSHYTVIEDPAVSEIFEMPDYIVEDSPEDRIEKIKTDARTKSRSVAFEYIVSILLVVAVGFFFALLLYPEMELSVMSRDNSDLKDEIAVLKKNILDSEEDVNGINDMDSIRAQALALGMQDPNANQVVSLPIPKDDKLVTVVSYDEYGISEEAYQNAIDNLAEYYTNNMQGES